MCSDIAPRLDQLPLTPLWAIHPAVIITIDGILGAGKSTAARKLAKRLGFIHLNSGALYRAVGLTAFRLGLPLDHEQPLIDLATELDFNFQVNEEGETDFFVNNEKWTDRVLGESVGSMASRIGVLKDLRAVLTKVQREIVKNCRSHGVGVVVEGRDSGTVVFPDAEVKFFLTASLDERVKRRLVEMQVEGTGDNVDVNVLRRDIEARDARDSNREASPLKIPDGAIIIDSSDKDADAVVGEMEERVKSIINN